MKAAKTLGLTIPITVLGRADEVIEQWGALLRMLTAAYGTKRRIAF